MKTKKKAGGSEKVVGKEGETKKWGENLEKWKK